MGGVDLGGAAVRDFLADALDLGNQPVDVAAQLGISDHAPDAGLGAGKAMGSIRPVVGSDRAYERLAAFVPAGIGGLVVLPAEGEPAAVADACGGADAHVLRRGKSVGDSKLPGFWEICFSAQRFRRGIVGGKS